MDLIKTFIFGIQDSITSTISTVKLLKSNSDLRSKITQCLILNGLVFLFSLVVFEKVLIPIVLYVVPLEASTWIDFILKTLFKVLWVLPLYIISRLLNVFWYQEIADLVYRTLKKPTNKPSGMPLSAILADVVYSVVVQCIFLVQASLVASVPVIGYGLHLSHMSLVYSLYAFEYVWMSQGLGVIQRTAIMHLNWCYFIGYGLIMAVSVSLSNSYFIGVCMFALLFPLLLISSHFRQKHQYHNLKIQPLPIFKPSIFLTEHLIKCFQRSR